MEFGYPDPVPMINSLSGFLIALSSFIAAVVSAFNLIQSRRNGRMTALVVAQGSSNADAIEHTRVQNVVLASAVEGTRIQNDDLATAVSHVHTCVETRVAELKIAVREAIPEAIKEAIPEAIKETLPAAAVAVVEAMAPPPTR